MTMVNSGLKRLISFEARKSDQCRPSVIGVIVLRFNSQDVFVVFFVLRYLYLYFSQQLFLSGVSLCSNFDDFCFQLLVSGTVSTGGFFRNIIMRCVIFQIQLIFFVFQFLCWRCLIISAVFLFYLCLVLTAAIVASLLLYLIELLALFSVLRQHLKCFQLSQLSSPELAYHNLQQTSKTLFKSALQRFKFWISICIHYAYKMTNCFSEHKYNGNITNVHTCVHFKQRNISKFIRNFSTWG